MAQQYFSWWRSSQAAVLLCAATLTACGGGGPGDTPRPPAADGQVAPLSANTSSISIRYAVADTYQGLTSSPTRQLNVVDRSSGVVAWHTALDMTRPDSPTWWVSEGSQRDSVTSDIRYLGPQLLYFVKQGQVFQMDIGGSAALVPQRISAVTNACGFGLEIFPVTPDGRHDWLVVRTSGPDGDCAQPMDNGQVLVSSSMPSTTAPIDVPATLPVVLNRLPDAQGQSTGLLTLDASLQRIVIKSNDLMQTLYTFPDDVGSNQFIRLLAPLPGQPNPATRVLAQVGARLQVFDRSGNVPTLGPVLATLSDPSARISYQVDAQGLYVAKAQEVLAIDRAGTVSTLTTLPSTGGNAIGLWLSTTSVLVLQDEGGIGSSTGPQVGRALWSIRRDTGNRQALVQGQVYDETAVLDVENGLVHYVQSSDGFTTDLHKVRDNGSGETLVAGHIRPITKVVYPTFSPGSVSLQGLVWCQPAPGEGDCSDAQVVSYNPISFAKTLLGTMPGEGANYTDARAVQHAWVGSPSLLYAPRWYAANTGSGFEIRTSLWLFSADTANSLREVPLPP